LSQAIAANICAMRHQHAPLINVRRKG
jgi:hypothetical protein